MDSRGRAFWEAKRKSTGEHFGCSLRPVTLERAMFEVAAFHEDFDFVEVSEERVAEVVRAAPPWVRVLVDMAKYAVKNVVKKIDAKAMKKLKHHHLGDLKAQLTLDTTEGEPKFHLSVQLAHGGAPRLKDATFLNDILQALGAIPLPDPMIVSPAGVVHFRWTNTDVALEELTDA